MYQGQEDDQQESGISCYTCGLETVDPHLDKVGKSEYPVIHDKRVSFDKLYDFLASFFYYISLIFFVEFIRLVHKYSFGKSRSRNNNSIAPLQFD